LWQVRKDVGAWKELNSWLDSTLNDVTNVRALPTRMGLRAVPSAVAPISPIAN